MKELRTSTDKELRVLTDAELDSVSGGLFVFGKGGDGGTAVAVNALNFNKWGYQSNTAVANANGGDGISVKLFGLYGV